MSAALTISATKFNEALETAERWKTKYNKMQTAGEAKAGLVVGGATVIGAEALAGYMRGRYGEKKLGPVNAEIVGGLACEVLALAGIFGKWSESIALVGHGTIGFAIGVEAMKIGEKHAVAELKPKTDKTVVETAGEEVVEQTTTVERKPAERLPPKTRRVDIRARHTGMAEDVVPAEPEAKTGT